MKPWGRVPSLYSLATLVGTAALSPVVIRFLAGRRVLDVPTHRSSHDRAVVRGLGLAPMAVSLVAGGVAAASQTPDLLAVLVAAIALALLGLVDDLRGLSVAVRLPAQVVVGAGVGYAITEDDSMALLVVIAAAVWFAGYVNAFNFMDGINGISGFHAGMTGVAWVVGAALDGSRLGVLVGGIAAAAAFGFLPFNFPTARAFLGDVGSYFFGAWLAAGSLLIAREISVALAVLPMSVYVADTAWTLLLRLRHGQRWHEAHRDHVYQRLVRGGWSHTRTTTLVAAITLVLGLAGVVASRTGAVGVAAALGIATVVNVLYLASPRFAFRTAPPIGGTGP